MKGFIKELFEQGIHITCDNGNLKINHDGNLTDVIKENIRDNKEAILAFFNDNNTQDRYTSIESIAVQESYPLSSAQYRLWILSQFEGGSEAYNLPVTTPLVIDDLGIFERAINAVIDRHEILRTVFKENAEGEIRQWVKERKELGFELIHKDYQQLVNADELVASYVSEDSVKPFDLENGPLLRMSLLQLTDSYYIFYYNMHHTISDGWSIDILSRDLMLYYEAFLSGEKVMLPELKIQYKDYTFWQKKELEKDVYKEHKSYWLNQLSGNLPVLDLPTSKARPKIFDHEGNYYTMCIAPETTQLFLNYCKKQQSSLYIGLLSVWNILFYKYSGQKDIIIGNPTAGRNHIDLKDQIGFYINTLALRNKVDAKLSFSEFFNKVKNDTLESYDHQMYPFDLLVDDLNIIRDSSRSAVFDVILTSQNIGNREEEVSNNKEYGLVQNGGKCLCKFDLELDFEEVGEGLNFRISYNTNVYEAEMITKLMYHFQELLLSILKKPEEKIYALNYLSAREQKELILDFNATDTAFSKEVSFLDMFQLYVQKTPTKIAVKNGNIEITYQELDELTDKFAQYLQDVYALSQGDLVVINIDRTHWLMTSVMSIFKLGCAYIPVDTSYPEERKQYILDDSNCKNIIDENFITSFLAVMPNITKTFSSVKITADDLAYIIYTSGSTGNPKGVMIEHKGMMNHFYVMESELELTSDSSIIQNAPYTFDISVWQLLNSLIVGGTTSIYDQETVLNSKVFLDRLYEERPTILQTVPSYLKVLLDMDESLERNSFEGLSYLLVTGDTVTKDLVTRWFIKYPAIKLVNAYGPAEASDDVTLHIMDAIPERLNISVGKPIQNMQMYVLDEYLGLCGIGIEGELCVSGIGLAKGYLNRDELTAEKFVDHPFKSGEKLYKTGDIGMWLPNGTLEFHGRRDNQVKINGFRIELEEIEYQLSQKNNIKEVLVTHFEAEHAKKELVAYVIVSETCEASEMRIYLQDKIPSYMIPLYYIQLEKFPLTANGKIDRKKLPNPQDLSLSNEIEYVGPQSEQEKTLITVCEAVLGRKNISMNDNFFSLGGESIKSIQIVSRLSQLGYKLKVDDIMRTPVFKGLAALIKNKIKEIDQSILEGEVLLTPIQEWLFSDENIKNPSHYNQSILIKSKNPLNNTLLNECIKHVVSHHDALRMVYVDKDGVRKQYNRNVTSKNYSLDFHDLTTEGSLKDQINKMSVIANELQSSINLTEGPLMRVGNFRLDDGDYIALIIHHLVIDGVSWRILLEDISTLYNLAEKNQRLVLPLKTSSFQEWSRALHNYAFNGISHKEQQYWKGLANTQIPNLPKDRQNLTNEKSPAEITFQLNSELTNVLQTKVHSVYNTEINDVLLTSLGLAIKEVLKVDRSIINMEGHGREEFIEDIDITRTIGWFTSLFPFILDVNAETNLYNLIKVKESLRKIPNKGVGYGMLKYITKEDFINELKPTIEFNYLGDFGNELNSENNEAQQFEYVSDSAGMNSDIRNTDDITLNISGMIVNNQLELTLFYNKEDYELETIVKLSNAYKSNLEKLIKELADANKQLLTPSDLTYSSLSIETLLDINHNNTIEDIYKLSPLQKGIYFFWLSNNNPKLFFDQVSYRFEGISITKDNVKKAFDILVSRHAILRTSFTNNIDEELLQIVHKNVPSSFAYEVVPQNLTLEKKKDYIEEKKQEDIQRGFDLSKPCQMRLTILDLGDVNYEFIWSHHHILMDGWCIRIMINEFVQILNSIENSIQLDLQTVYPYSNYIKWLDTINEQKSLDYWDEYLLDVSKKTELPYKKSDYDEDKDFSKSIKSILINNDLYNEMKALCLNIGVSHNIFIQSVWGYLLSNYNNTQDVVFGTVVSGRPGHIDGIENMVGLFVNTIPVRVKYEVDDTPRQLIERLQQNFLDNQEHHFTGLSEIQSRSSLDSELINHTLTFENYPLETTGIESKNENEKESKSGVKAVEYREQMNYQFGIFIYPADNGIQIEFEYNENNFETTLIENLAEQFKKVISEFLLYPNKSLKKIEIISDREQKELLGSYINTTVDYNEHFTIVDAFNMQLLTHKDQIVLSTAYKTYTYKELDDLSNQYANFLTTEYNIQQKDYVGIQLERSEWVVISILAILKIGGTYVPIDPLYPEERIQYIVEDSACKLLINNNILEQFKNGSYDLKLENTTILPQDIAYALYTSGSTGKPKGVMISHGSLMNYLEWSKGYYFKDQNCSNDFGLFTSLSFDLTVTSLFLPILNGGKLHIYDSEFNITEILKHYFESELSYIKLTPAHISVLESLNIGKSNINTAIVGGDKLEQKHINILKRINPSIQIYNEYGPTETTVGCVVYNATEVSEGEILIGKPIANTEIFILNELGVMQPIGIKGEMYIGGKGLALGYLNKEVLTQEKFIPHPYKVGERLYKTGDICKWLLDGNIQFYGRKDDQVKIRGYRIELGEIESYLKNIETIDEAVVLIKKTEEEENRIVVYFVSKENITVTTLIEYLHSKIPGYMLPSEYIRVDELPITINGKIDKNALLKIEENKLEKVNLYTGPRNEIEEKLIEIWADILKIEPGEISIHANFMDLGGHSLKVIRVIARIQKEFGIKINIQKFFDNPILEVIAENISNVVWDNSEEELESFKI
ncbi:non-ribosomal peptide synthetase [Flavobacterium sp. '19STA2R22 D10 B1']|uniref:non-ribosomal peptide synthetase n=1 Tax=Flavobacterium aerium TaxID=3037261 RepID=UPI00278C3D7C|nr:non-ribosomal peptide synthetase [Flavobacterium sp. '19STA2R22 D10 B1']